MSETEKIKELEGREAYLKKRKFLYQKNKERIAAQNKDRYLRKKDEYLVARKEWKIKNADKVKESGRVYNIKTKEWQSQKSKARRNANGDELNKRQREIRANRTHEQKNREIEYAKNYRLKNKERIREYRKSIAERMRANKKAWHHKKYRTDPQYKILHNLRSRIKNALNGKAKDSTTIKLLGCDLKTFQNHIENKFTEGMNWGMVLSGKIHIDHIIPCAKFDLTKPEEQRKCFHYTNLQPLWAVDNLKKGAKYVGNRAA